MTSELVSARHKRPEAKLVADAVIPVLMVVFIRERLGTYRWDLVQNDPFLRAPVVIMLSSGAENDARIMRTHYPGARLAHQDDRGQVWVLDSSQSDSRPRSSSTPAR